VLQRPRSALECTLRTGTVDCWICRLPIYSGNREESAVSEMLMCDYCHEECEKEPIRRGDKVYCCEACAFEATRSADCSGRPDSNIASQPLSGRSRRMLGKGGADE
jgi:hypothetical protein